MAGTDKLKPGINCSDQNTFRAFKRANKSCKLNHTAYRQAIKAVNEAIMEVVMEGTYSVRIPNYGLLFLDSYKGKFCNFKKTKEYGKTFMDRNLHTDGIIYHIKFYVRFGRFPLLRNYKFRTADKHKVTLSKIIKNGL